ncbi:MAG: class IV adenylate cyclase [Candidatus Doudnabacteria bacterium]|jgi:predicted adenylyl cyclase CyaB
MSEEINNREIEVRFLGINVEEIVKKLLLMGAKDKGEELLEETIFYDLDKKWLAEKKVVRLRKTPTKQLLTYKHTTADTPNGTEEIEMTVDDLAKTKSLLEALGLKAFRIQEKKRRIFLWDGVEFAIDEHPMVPPYLEIEGPSETLIKDAARAVELDWKDAHFESSRDFIENYYKIPLTSYKTYTFKKIE